MASKGFDILYLFLLADLFCCAFVVTVFYSFYNKVNEKNAYVSIIIGLVAGILMFPFPDFSKSLLVGLFFPKDLFCCAFVVTVFYSFYNKVNENTAYASIIIGLVAGFLMFPFPDFSKSLLVGVFLSKDLFSPFIAQSLLFLSFLVATFLPVIILKIKFR